MGYGEAVALIHKYMITLFDSSKFFFFFFQKGYSLLHEAFKSHSISVTLMEIMFYSENRGFQDFQLVENSTNKKNVKHFCLTTEDTFPCEFYSALHIFKFSD